VLLPSIFGNVPTRGEKSGVARELLHAGRKSDQPHTVPVTLIEQDGQRWLVAPYGVVQWVRNIQAAGMATLTRGRRSEVISDFPP